MQPALPATVAGVILAGGTGRRMGGQDKAFIELGGEPLVARAVRAMRGQCARVLISANGDHARFAPLGCEVIADTIADAGPLAGLLAAMDHAAAASSGIEWILSAPVDCPFLPDDLCRRLYDAAMDAKADAAIAMSGGRAHFACGLWRIDLRAMLQSGLGERDVRRVEDFARDAGAVTCDWPAQPFDPFMNINRPEDLLRAQGITAR